MSHTSRRRRALGQHFLVDSRVSDRTIAFAELAPGEPVLEIGPGRGALTDRLLASGHPVTAVEVDEELAGVLERRTDPRLHVVRGDFLELDPGELPPGPIAVVSNLPYSTGTPIVEKLLREPQRFPRIVVMLQREVAERIAADPGSRRYGALSVLTAFQARATLGFLVPPEAFSPPPAVDSAVVRLDVAPSPRVATADPIRFRAIVRLAFGQRRKTLRNALGAGLGGAAVAEEVLHRASIDPGRRAETLSLPEFAQLADASAAAFAIAGGDGLA